MPDPSERARSNCYDRRDTPDASTLRGKVWPNLVFVHDSGQECVEFRLQCEILLPIEVARELEAVFLPEETPSMSWEDAVELLVSHRHPDADPYFEEVLRFSMRKPVSQVSKVGTAHAK